MWRKMLVVLLGVGVMWANSPNVVKNPKAHPEEKTLLKLEPVKLLNSIPRHSVVRETKGSIFSESFEGTDFPPSGWISMNVNADDQDTVARSTSTAYDGSASARFSSYYTHEANEWLISPGINIPDDGKTYYLRYYVRADDYGSESYKCQISTSQTDTANADVLVDETISGTDWLEREYDLSSYAGQTIYIQWKYYSDYEYFMWLDAVSVYTQSDYDISVDSVRIISGILYRGDTDTFRVYLSNKGAQDASDFYIVFKYDDERVDSVHFSSVSSGAVDSADFVYTGEGGCHDFYFFSTWDSDEDRSNDTIAMEDWNVSGKLFTLPYENGFENDDWYCGMTFTASGYGSIGRTSSYAHNGSYSMLLYNSDYGDGTANAIVLVDNGDYNTLSLDFWWKTNSFEGGETLRVQYSFDGSNWINLDSLTSDQDWTHENFAIDVTGQDSTFIRWHFVGNSPDYGFIDDVAIAGISKDVGVVSIDTPVVEYGWYGMLDGNPSATFRNNAASPDTFFAEFIISNGAERIYYDSATIILEANADTTFTFDPYTGDSGIAVYDTVKITNAGDSNPTNDEMTRSYWIAMRGDQFFVSDPDGNHNSGPEVYKSLNELGYVGRYFQDAISNVPNPRSYKFGWFCVGVYGYEAYEPTHADIDTMAMLLENGIHLVLEGGDVFGYSEGSANKDTIDSLFGVNPAATSDGSSGARMGGYVRGFDNSVAPNITGDDFWTYDGDDNWLDHLTPFGSHPWGGTSDTIFVNADTSFVCGVAYDRGDDYGKAVALSFEAGGTHEVSSKQAANTFIKRIVERESQGGFFNVAPTFVTENSATTLPTRVKVLAPHPNPMRSKGYIEFALPAKSRVTIELYNVAGRKVKTLVDREFRAGYHTVRLNTKGLASGIYFYRFRAGHYTATRKLVIVR